MEPFIQVKNYQKLKRASQEGIPAYLFVYEKDKDVIEMKNNYVESNIFWDKISVEPKNLYDLAQTKNLLDILSDYDARKEDILLTFYDLNHKHMNKANRESLEVYSVATFRKIFSHKELKQLYTTWKESNAVQLEKDKEIFQQLEKSLKWLNQKVPKSDMTFKTSPIEIISATLEADCMKRVKNHGQIEYHPLRVKDGFDIFLKSQVSREIPFISYKGRQDKDVIIKIFNGDYPITLDKVKPSDQQLEEPNTIQVVVWTEIYHMTKSLEAFSIATIYLETGKLVFSTKITDKNMLDGKPTFISRIQKHLPIELQNLNESNNFGEFRIYGCKLNVSLFLDMIMMNSNAHRLIYMDESSSPYSIKKRITFHLREPSIYMADEDHKYFSLLIHQDVERRPYYGKVLDYRNPKSEVMNTTIHKNTPVIRVMVNKSQNRETLQLGLLVFTQMIGIFKHMEKSLNEEYLQYGIRFSKDFQKVWKIETGKGTKMNIKEDEFNTKLEAAAPHIFEKGYGTTVCQMAHQPVIIPNNKEMIALWNRENPQKPISYPPDPNAEILLGCNKNDKEVFVSMKENPLSNKGEYPYLPCCTKINTQIPGSHSYFTHYYLGEALKEKKNVQTEEIFSRKILLKGQRGTLNPLIESTFRLLHLYKSGEGVRRFGVYHSPFSAILCILYGIQDTEFMKLYAKKDTKENNDKINALAEKLLKRKDGKTFAKYSPVYANVMAQELYDFSTKDMQEKLRESAFFFFDTFELYRWLEETFQIHVFVFSSDKEQNIQLEIPRHKYFSARPFLHRRCIVLYKHYGSDIDEAIFPQYEIIGKEEKDGSVKTWFWPEAVSKKFLKIFARLQKTYQVEVSTQPNHEGKKMILRNSPYSELSYHTVFPNAKSQYIDEIGKLRGITLPIGTNEEERITIYVPPSQPLNLPEEESEYAVDIDTALKMFEHKPTAYALEGEMVSGLWFPIFDIDQGVFIPIIEMSFEDFNEYNLDIPVGRENPFYAYGENLTDQLHNVEKMRNNYLQCLLWVFLIYTQGQYEEKQVETFLQEYFVMRNFEFTDELRGVNTSLPDTRDLDYALSYLEDYFPFVYKKKFVYINKKMLSRLRYYLLSTCRNKHKEEKVVDDRIKHAEEEDMEKEMKENINVLMKKNARDIESEIRPDEDLAILSRLFDTPEDFPRHYEMQVFISLPEFKTWLYSKIYGRGEKISIIERLDISLSTIRNPFLYKQKESNQIFIIQNVSLGDRLRALNNAYVYQKEGNNLGYLTPKMSTKEGKEMEKHVETYIISPAGNLELFEAGKNEGKEHLKILDYGDEIYASLLQIV